MVHVDFDHTPPKEDVGAVSKIMRAVALPVSLFTGGWVTKVQIEDKAYDRFKQYGGLGKFDGLDDIHQEFKEAHEGLMKDANTLDSVVRTEGTLADMSEKLDKAYFPEVKKRMEGAGVTSFRDKLTHVSRSGKQRAMIEGMMVSAVLVGSILGIANSKIISELFDDKDKDDISR